MNPFKRSLSESPSPAKITPWKRPGGTLTRRVSEPDPLDNNYYYTEKRQRMSAKVSERLTRSLYLEGVEDSQTSESQWEANEYPQATIRRPAGRLWHTKKDQSASAKDIRHHNSSNSDEDERHSASHPNDDDGEENASEKEEESQNPYMYHGDTTDGCGLLGDTSNDENNLNHDNADPNDESNENAGDGDGDSDEHSSNSNNENENEEAANDPYIEAMKSIEQILWGLCKSQHDEEKKAMVSLEAQLDKAKKRITRLINERFELTEQLRTTRVKLHDTTKKFDDLKALLEQVIRS